MHTPVLVGVGTASTVAPVAELMTLAAQAAACDAGDAATPACSAPSIGSRVPQGSWDLIDPGRTVATRIGAGSARSVRYEIGVSQQEVINDALDAIATGACEMVLVVGAEDRAFARRGGLEVDDSPAPPDDVVTRPPDFVAPIEMAAGIVWPVAQQYALIENALAAAEQLSTAAQRDDIAALWSRFNLVAQGNPLAAFATPRSADRHRHPGTEEPTALLPVQRVARQPMDGGPGRRACCSARSNAPGGAACRLIAGSSPRWRLHSSAAITLTARRHLHAGRPWPCSARRPRPRWASPLRDLPLTEVYSCFPAAVRGPATRAGPGPEGHPHPDRRHDLRRGPVQQLRPQLPPPPWSATCAPSPASSGLITTVSGMLSKPGLAVWSACTPRPADAHIADLGPRDDGTPPRSVPVAPPDAADGPATVASFTVTYGTEDPSGPVRTAMVARPARRDPHGGHLRRCS